MNPSTIFFVLEQLNYACHSRTGKIRTTPQDDFHKRVLSFAKQLRKDLNKSEIREKGLNIYDKREQSIHSIMEHLVELELISIIDGQVNLLSKGFDYIMNIYTDDFSASYLQYRKEVLDFLEQRNETDFTEEMIAKLYFGKNSLEDIQRIYFYESKDLVAEFHSFIIDALNQRRNEDSFVFHFCPRIFLPYEYSDEKISLDIEGIEISNDDIFIGRPYPNRRYAVAGMKLNNTPIFSGFYPIISAKDQFPQEKKIIMKWDIGETLKVIHSINVKFSFDRGNFFSTYQSLSRGNSLDYINLVTTIEDEGYFKDNRNPMIKTKVNEIFIEEDVTLTSFPMHLHCFTYSHSQFEKFKEKKLKI